jgi:hypothetical protein
MYNKDSNLRGAGEKYPWTPDLIEEYIRCKNDILYFAEKYFYIISLDEGKIKIPLRDYQKKMLKSFVYPNPEKRHHICLLPRQSGKSTISTVYLLWYALFNEDKEIAILANKEKTAKKILRRVKLAYKLLPIWLQKGIVVWNETEIHLDNDVKISSSSTASTANRGDSINILFLDEFAFVPSNIADEFMGSVYPTIASSKKSQIIAVSTPNGMNHFHHIWKNAVRGKNSFKPIKVRWNEVPGYDEQFKIDTIRDLGLKKWRAEFETKFLGSSQTLVDAEMLERMETIDPMPEESHSYDHHFSLYEKPVPGVSYVIGVDSGKGIGSDYSVAQVLRIDAHNKVKQVAIYRNNEITYHRFAQLLIGIAKYYNSAMLMIENNEAGMGNQVADTIWYEFDYGNIVNLDKHGLGVRATRTSKLAANMHLKRYIENGWLEICDSPTISELSRYEEIKPDIFKASGKGNDDCVMALLWGVYFLTTDQYDGVDIAVKTIDDEFKLKDYDGPIAVFDDHIPVQQNQDYTIEDFMGQESDFNVF